MRRTITGLLATLLLVGPTQAQMAAQGGEHSAQTCPADPVAPPPALAGWVGRVAVSAAGRPDAIDTATILPGRGADVALLSVPDVTYPVRPSHPGGTVSYGGLLGFTVTQAGTYRVGIGSGAWLEMVRDGQALLSTAHSPGPACTGLRKMVDFALTPGAYLLEISGNGSPTLPLLVTRLP
ncbi:homogentisate 1,2-dioxygenase [Sphingomonas sp. MMS24-J13]|uniref:homogentisate 1,2-dioxygenase n=1 Tax=Sphingomonas sp. MMS24-J13 TaxID=3238686 RepID=UPI00384B039D